MVQILRDSLKLSTAGTRYPATTSLPRSVDSLRSPPAYPRGPDFRVVQGALNADGAGNLLSGILGTLPNTTYSSSVSLAEITRIGARRMGVVIGVLFFALAFFPKFTAIR